MIFIIPKQILCIFSRSIIRMFKIRFEIFFQNDIQIFFPQRRPIKQNSTELILSAIAVAHFLMRQK